MQTRFMLVFLNKGLFLKQTLTDTIYENSSNTKEEKI